MSGGKSGKITTSKDGLDKRSLLFWGAAADIISTGEFQRLDYINNLGLGYKVYHNAQLKRFSHCQGSAFLGRMFAQRLGMGEKDAQTLEIALLSHDLGHGPCSHVTSKWNGIDHEDVSVGIVTGEIVMPRAYCGDIPEILDSWGIDKSEIAAVMKGEHPHKALNTLYSGKFDLDKADYLRRDSHATGAEYGNLDIDRMADVLVEHKGDICLLEEGIDSMVHFLKARIDMYRNVYRHKKVIIYEAMLNKAIEVSGLDTSNIWWKTDDELLNDLWNTGGRSRELIDMIKSGIPYDRVVMLKSNDKSNLAAARKLEKVDNLCVKIAESAGLEPYEVAVSFRCTKPKDKKPEFPLKLDRGDVVNLFDYSPQAAEQEKRPPTHAYLYVGVHPEVSQDKKEKVAGVVDEMKKAA